MAKKIMIKAHRPAGAPNTRSGHLRDELGNKFRCTHGFNKVCEMLIESGHYKSRADIYHDALQQLAIKKSIDIEHYLYHVQKIQ